MFSKFPKPFLLQKYKLTQFNELLNSVKQGILLLLFCIYKKQLKIFVGNLKAFLAALATYQDFFIKHGIYLMLEKLKTQVYRNLLKKMYISFIYIYIYLIN